MSVPALGQGLPTRCARAPLPAAREMAARQGRAPRIAPRGAPLARALAAAAAAAADPPFAAGSSRWMACELRRLRRELASVAAALEAAGIPLAAVPARAAAGPPRPACAAPAACAAAALPAHGAAASALRGSELQLVGARAGAATVVATACPPASAPEPALPLPTAVGAPPAQRRPRRWGRAPQGAHMELLDADQGEGDEANVTAGEAAAAGETAADPLCASKGLDEGDQVKGTAEGEDDAGMEVEPAIVPELIPGAHDEVVLAAGDAAAGHGIDSLQDLGEGDVVIVAEGGVADGVAAAGPEDDARSNPLTELRNAEERFRVADAAANEAFAALDACTVGDEAYGGIIELVNMRMEDLAEARRQADQARCALTQRLVQRLGLGAT